MSSQKKNAVKHTKIGGQALMEGVMMQGATSMAMAVRTSDGEILTETKRLKGHKWFSRIPILRGVVAFINSLVRGTGTLLRSSEVIFPEEETPSKGAFALASVFGVVLAVALFMLLPSFLVSIFEKYVVQLNVLLSSLLEGGVRILLFLTYLILVSRMKDIRRTFMYHGAEHRTINCFERGLPLTVDNVQSCSTRHNRCGTTFLFFVIIVSILVFSLVSWVLSLIGIEVNALGKMGVRLLFLPLVAGLSYELLRFLAILPDNKFVDIFRAPGLALQRLTTYPPTPDMAEIALISFNLVREMDDDQSIEEHKFGEFTLTQIRKIVENRLDGAGITELCEVDWIICEATGLKRNELSEKLQKTTYSQYRKIIDITKKRAEHIPLDYVVGKSYFYGETLVVNESVLIPRLDTEVVAETAINCINESGAKNVLDLMTGSGCIALAIAKNTTATVMASDISEDALNVAKINLGDYATTVLSDGFTNITGKFDVIVSNPPYIDEEAMKSLEKEVLCQPEIALFGGSDGLKFYRLIINQATDFLNDNGVLILEIGYDQREKVCNLLSENFTDITCIKDLQGNDRVIKAVKKL